MCRSCWHEYGEPIIDTPEVRQAAAIVADLYEEHGSGGWLHIVVDDWNLGQEHLVYCAGVLKTATERRCYEALNALTEEERASALALHDGFWEGGAL